MEFETFDCNRCGASLTQIDEETYKCQYCGKVFHVKDAVAQTKSFKEMFDDNRREHINNLRRNLYEAANAQYISSKDVEACADELKHEIPDDFLASFFKIASGKDDRAICRFIRKIDVKKHYGDIDHIITFLIRSLQPAFMLDVANLIERAYKNTDLVEFEKHATALSIEQEKVKKGVYEVTLPREVFVAYSSKDMEKVVELVDVLEAQGFECFVAARNLRHGKGAVEDYNKALEDAMDHCKCFVFVSSLNSRSTGCDAVRIEIPHIQKIDIANAPAGQRNNYALVPHEYKKPRVEYRIEESKGFNVADKITNEFFEGYERVYSPEEVAVRVLKQITAQAEKKVKYCRSCGEEHEIDAKFCSNCGNSIFVDDEKLVDHSAPVIPGVVVQGADGVTVESDPAAAISGSDATVKRGFMHLSFGEFEDADNAFEKALDQNSKNANAYLGKLMVNLRVKNEEELIAYPRPFNENKYFKYAIRWADTNFARKLNGYIDRINDRIESERKDAVLKQACEMIGGEDIAVYQKAIALLESISPWKESKERIEECYRRIEAIELAREHERMDRVYEEACLMMCGYDADQYREAVALFCTIPEWKDSREKIEECNKTIEAILNQNEHDRLDNIYRKASALMALQGLTVRQRLIKHEEALALLESIRDYEKTGEKIAECTNSIELLKRELDVIAANEEKKKNARRKRKIIVRSCIAGVLTAAIAFVFIFNGLILPDAKYSQAVKLMEDGEFDKAIILFTSLDGYKDSEELILECRSSATEAAYKAAVQLMNEGKYDEAIAAFKALGGYKDSEKLIDDCENVENEENYSEAVSLMKSGKYAQALELFKALNGYKDSSEQAKRCETALLDADYKAALDLYNKGKYEEAMDAFSKLGAYSNSTYMFELCRDEVYAAKYAKAVELMNDGQYAAAYSIFLDIAGYKDAGTLKDTCYAYSSLSFTINDEGTAYTVTGYNGSAKSVVVPPYYNELPVIAIGENAFSHDTTLESVVIPEGVLIIEPYAFSGCTSLKSVILPDTFGSIGQGAFSDCSALESITLPFVGGTENDASNYYFAYIFGAYSYSESYYVPSSLTSVVIKGGSIAGSAFYNCSNIKSVTLPDTLSRIGQYAFNYCTSLESITLPESLVSIGEYAFQGCSSLLSVTLPEGLTAIENYTFSNCENLSSINIPDSVTSIGERAFSYCYKLSDLYLGVGIETIGSYAFDECSSLGQIVFSDKLVSIGTYAFEDCSGITSITVPPSVKNIGSSAFRGCSSLESITLPFVGSSLVDPSYTNFGYVFGTTSYYSHDSYVPSSLKTVVITGGSNIAYYAFYNCDYITTLTLPDTLTSISNYALYSMDSLKTLSLPFIGASRDGTLGEEMALTHFGYIFGASSYNDNSYYVPTSLQKVTVTDCTTIYQYAFYLCVNLSEIELLGEIDTIGQYAFSDCTDIKKVTLPRSIKNIGEGAFCRNYNLSTITFSGTEEEWGNVTLGQNWIYDAGIYTTDGAPTLSMDPKCNGEDHEYIVILAAVEPTCTETGLTEGQYCSLCEVTLLEQEVIEALGHSIVAHEAYAALICTDDSWDAYEACERCDYSTQVVVPGVDHVLVEHAGQYADCDSTVDGWTDYVTCENCNYTTREEILAGHILTYHEAQEPTCENIGWDAYEECSRCGHTTYSEKASLGHAFDESNNCSNCGLFFDSGLTFELGDDGYYYVSGRNEAKAEIIIPAKYNGVQVIGIYDYALRNCTDIVSITIPGSITKFGYGAFEGCTGLTGVYISDLSAWCSVSFSDYTSNPLSSAKNLYVNGVLVEELAIPEGIDTISSNAFSGCTSITSVTVPDSVVRIGSSAFYGCTAIKSMSLPFVGYTEDESNYIGYIFGASGYSYQDESWGYVPTSLVSVVITGGQTIPSYAFYNCQSIKSITIPETVHTINYSAFYGCAALESFTIHEGIATIGGRAFYGCSALTEIIIPGSVTSIESYAFYDCSGITEITVPDSVTSIGSCTFYGCSSLEKITLPFVGSGSSSGYTNFGYIFGTSSYGSQGSSNGYIPVSLKTVVITGGTYIDNNAFYNCDNLTSITLPNTVQRIGRSVFYGCTSLESLTIPFVGYSSPDTSYTNIGYIFSGSSYYTDNETSVPASLKTLVITGEEDCYDYAFHGCTSLESITILGSTTAIGPYAFAGCSSLESLTLPEGVVEIGSFAFANCSSLERIEIPEGVTQIRDGAFSGCTSITSITVPDSVTTIGSATFRGCSSLESITIPFVGGNVNATEASSSTLFGYIFGTQEYEGGTSKKQQYSASSSVNYYFPDTLKSVTVTGGKLLYGAFSGCGFLQEFNICSGVTHVDSTAFNFCRGSLFTEDTTAKYFSDILIQVKDTSVTSYEIEQGTRIIASGAFAGCSALTEIVIPDSVVTICDNAFADCTLLAAVVIPDSVVNVGESIFTGCTALQTVTLGDALTSIPDRMFNNCAGLKSITIGSSVSKIGSYAFAGCTSLVEVSIPESVKEIGDHAFSGCSAVESLTLAEGIESIGEYAFLGMSKMTEITVPDSVTLIGKGAFSGWSALESISLPFVGATPQEEYSSYYNSGVLGYIFGSDEYDGATATSQQYYSSNTVSYYIPNTLSSVTVRGGMINHGAFSGCTNITEVILGDGVTSIAERAFLDAAGLIGIIIPETVESIGDYAFYNCSALTSLTIPNSVTSIGYSALYGCSTLASLSVPFPGYNATDTSSSNTLGYLFGASSYSYNSSNVPASLKSVVLTGGYDINAYAFYECTKVETVKLAEGTANIGNYAFYGCKALADIDLPESIVNINRCAFYRCSALTEIELPSGLQSIEQSAFEGCSSLTAVSIPDSVTTIQNAAFAGCSGLESITLPFVGSSLTPDNSSDATLFGYIFGHSNYSGTVAVTQQYSDTNSVNYYIPANLKNVTVTGGSVLYGAFSGCSMIERIVIGDSVTAIGAKAFDGCVGLAEIVLGNGIKSISSSAFDGCTAIEYKEKDGVYYIGNENNPYMILVSVADKTLATYEIDENVKLILDGAFEGCDQLASITIPEGVTAIGDNAFYGCTSLESIVIPDAVVRIGDNAFYGCSSLAEVTVGSSVAFIGINAFAGCNLSSAIFNDTEGWFCTADKNAESGSTIKSSLLSDPENAATYLFWDMSDYYWKKAK